MQTKCKVYDSHGVACCRGKGMRFTIRQTCERPSVATRTPWWWCEISGSPVWMQHDPSCLSKISGSSVLLQHDPSCLGLLFLFLEKKIYTAFFVKTSSRIRPYIHSLHFIIWYLVPTNSCYLLIVTPQIQLLICRQAMAYCTAEFVVSNIIKLCALITLLNTTSESQLPSLQAGVIWQRVFNPLLRSTHSLSAQCNLCSIFCRLS